MKKLYPLLSGLFIVAIFGLLSNSGGRASQFGQDNTGSPISNGTCANAGCHSAGAFDVDLDIELRDANGALINEYEPGLEYDLTMRIVASGNPNGYGFQMVSLDDNNNGVNGFSNPSSGVQISDVSGIQYPEQAGSLGSNVVTMKWTAPAPGTGNVNVYAVGNALNDNGSPAGDGVGTGSVTISEKMTSSTINTEIVSSIYPNPVQNVLRVDYAGNDILQYDIYPLSGAKVATGSISGSSSIDMSDQTTGIYLVQFRNSNNEQQTLRIIKE